VARATPILKNVGDERIPARLEEVHFNVNPTFEHLVNVYVNLGPNGVNTVGRVLLKLISSILNHVPTTFLKRAIFLPLNIILV
jgi:hypothetical protein